MTGKQRLNLFEKAIEQPAEKRLSFLKDRCGDDTELYRQLVSMLELHSGSSSFLDTDAILMSEDTSDRTASPLPARTEALAGAEALRLDPGDRLLGRYEVVAAIGRGGMGEVYQCSDLKLEREVAVKVQRLVIENAPDMRDRFLREIRSVAGLSHPNIVTLHDFATDGDLSFAVMEFVRGKSLAQWNSLDRDVTEVLFLARDIASGLAAAHANLLMHRDIKPANIMVSEDGTAKILDFGLARQTSSNPANDITGAEGQVQGTAPYMSPEQASGETLSCATDVFSFGTMLFDMFTGENPFRGDNLLDSIRRVSEASRIHESLERGSRIPSAVAGLISAMQRRDPQQRPSAAELYSSITKLLKSKDYLSTRIDAAESEVENNLPSRSIELEGRDEAIATLHEQVDQFPVVSLVGTGGVGKTSLAIRLAQERKQKYRGGVWFCALASVDQSADLAGVVSGNVAGNAGSFAGLDELITRLSGGPVLLVLDNCEHVIDNAAELTETLCERVPEITVLATSREALSVPRECVHRLDGLAVEGDNSDAAELFRHRSASFARLDSDESTKQQIQDIVLQLEGLPLAIELAAACLSTMTLRELHDSLDDQLSTLQGGRRRSRQATLHQTIQWSFDLLTAEEQNTLQLLTVFRAAFSSQAAIEVCNLGRSGRFILQRLVEKSVLSRLEFGGESRFRMLEPIRQFCLQRDDHSELGGALQRHALFYADRAKKLGNGINGFDELRCADELNLEWPDLRAAIAWGREHRRFDIAVLPVVDLARNIMFHLRTEAYGWLIAAEEIFKDEFATRADALWVLANGHWLMANPELCEEVLDRADAIQVSPQNLWVRYFLRFSQNRFEESIAAAEQAERLAGELNDPIEQRWWANAFKACPMAMANPDDPRIDPTIQASSRHVASLDWPTGKAFFALAEGTVLINRRQMPKAIEKYQEIIKIARQCGNLWIELISRLVFNEAANPNIPPAVKLGNAVTDLRSLLENGEEAHFPIAIRCIVIAFSDCGFHDDAVRCSSIVPSLPGVGEKSEFTPTYPMTIEQLRDKYDDDQFEALLQQGASLTPDKILSLAGELLNQMN
ncbi:MAG: protein kinase [Planctomycetota bacterium]